jgi:hypothetical protein
MPLTLNLGARGRFFSDEKYVAAKASVIRCGGLMGVLLVAAPSHHGRRRHGVPHIFAAGDVIGRQMESQMATTVGSRDGGTAAHNALSVGPMRRVDHRVIPRVIFTDPQAAVVGLTEEAAVAAGHPGWCHTLQTSLVPRAGAIRDTRGSSRWSRMRAQARC